MTPEEAYNHAKKNEGSDKLREICCKDPKYAYLYALDVDRCYHVETRRAFYISFIYYQGYLNDVLGSKYLK